MVIYSVRIQAPKYIPASSHLYFDRRLREQVVKLTLISNSLCSKVNQCRMPKYLRLVVAGGSCVGKTAVIEQAVFGKHSPGQVSTLCTSKVIVVYLTFINTHSCSCTELAKTIKI